MGIDLNLKSNFNLPNEPFQTLNKTAWKIIKAVIGIILTLVVWYVGLAWMVIDFAMTFHIQKVANAKSIEHMRRKRRLAAMAMIENQGQMVNTRQASDSIRVVYGIAKTGGTWVFNKASRTSNQMLNTIISWCEGEVEGIATGIDTIPIYSGSTLDDAHPMGEFVYAGCSCDGTCYSYTPCSCNMTCDGYT